MANGGQFQPEPIFWVLRPGGLYAIYSDKEALFLIYGTVATESGYPQRGAINKRLFDGFVESGLWRVITNPAEAFLLECFINSGLALFDD